MKKKLLVCSIALFSIQLQAQTTYQKYLHNLDVAVGGGLHSVQFNPKEKGDQDPLFGGTVNIHYRYAPFKRWSFATGIDLTSYRAESEYDTLSSVQKRVDPENGYTGEYRVGFKNWSEVQNSINLEIPIAAYYRLPINDVWGMVFGGGVKLDLPFYKKYKTRNDKTDGYIDRTEYFEETNVDYSDLPQHDLYKTDTYKGNAKLKGAGLSGFLEVGASRPLKKNRSLYLGAYFSHSFTNNVKKANDELYNAADDKYRGVISSDLVSNAHLMALGLKVGLSWGWPTEEKIDSSAIIAERLAEEARLAEEKRINDSIQAAQEEQERLAREEQERLAREEEERKAAELKKAQEVVAWLNKNIRVNFALGKADVVSTPEVEENIDFIVKFLRNNPDRILVVVGHTCDLGKPEKNVELSKRRAEAMKAVLVGRGCNPGNIDTIGKGPYEPLVPNTSEANRKKNRRIEIQIGQYQEKDIQ
ncbi:MAG: OmpA family protein [Paludibacteraceae bacterium]|nr:OmpA family protein [Paludibacteraceae bacterium]